MKKVLWRRLAVALLAVPLLAATAPGAAADQQEKDHERMVIRSIARCPEITVLDESGEPVQWIGRAKRGFLGVELTQLTPELRRHFGVPEDSGVMIGRVVEDSAAAAAGLQVGDIITRIDGEETASAGAVGRAVRQKEGGEVIAVELWRDGAALTFDVTLGEQERCTFDLGHLPKIDLERLGNMGFEISEEALEALRGVDWGEALENLRAIDWEEHFKGLQMIDKERIEEQMERTRERLERLEERLEREQERLERLEREDLEELEGAARDREREQRELEREQRELEREQQELEREQREQREQREREREDGGSGSEI